MHKLIHNGGHCQFPFEEQVFFRDLENVIHDTARPYYAHSCVKFDSSREFKVTVSPVVTDSDFELRLVEVITSHTNDEPRIVTSTTGEEYHVVLSNPVRFWRHPEVQS